MDWDPDVTQALERMTIYRRERLRARLVERAAAAGRARVTAADLEAARAGGMVTRDGAGATGEPLPAQTWPVLGGAYRVLDPDAPVAICTLASEGLADALGDPPDVAIVGRAFTENLGIEKVALNIVANPAIRVLVLCGTESRHRVGQALRALHEHGLDGDGRVIGAEGPLPVLRNLPPPAQAIFHDKLALVDLIGENDVDAIRAAVASSPRGRTWPTRWAPPDEDDVIGTARTHGAVMRPEDRSGFLLLSVGVFRDRLVLEHYSNEALLLRRLAARTAEDLCRAAVAAGVVSELSHATYLGREATKAEIALRSGLPYEQDRPLEVTALR